MENIHTDTTYSLKKPNKTPNYLSIEPTPVQVTALPRPFPKTIIKNKVYNFL